ncbi:MAG: response regulator, partial [Pseudomonadales bacterium]
MTAKIFVVEDQALVARDIQTRLVSMGYEVLGTASRASDAVTQVLLLQPDLVLMDINLKGEMDGIEAATQIAAEADIPVIYCTAYSNEATLARAKITAPYGYVLKPFDNRELEINIEISLHKHQLEQTIKQGRERLAATLSSVSEAIISANQQGEILFANEAACRLLARPFADLVGLDLRGAIRLGALEMGEAALDLTALPLDAALNDLAPKRQRLISAEDEMRPVEVELSWFDSELEPLVIVTLREITRQLEQEDAILRGAYFDALTLLPNRALFLDRLDTRIVQGGDARPGAI